MHSPESSYQSSSDSDDKHSNSLLYTLLPKLVRSRICRIPSIRKSFHQYSKSYSYNYGDDSCSEGTKSLEDLSTPPPEYRSRVSLSEPVSDGEIFDEEVRERPGSSSSSASRSKSSRSRGGNGSADDIKWTYGSQGISLLNIAADEDAQLSSRRRNSASAAQSTLSRQLYIHGLTYLLRGLPTHLTTEEKISIWSSVPSEVHELSKASDLIRTSEHQMDDSVDQPSILHQILAACVVRIFLTCQILLPYLKVFLRAVFSYERQHRVSERVLSSSMTTVEGMMKNGAQMGDTICRMNDGKVGQAINDAMVYWVKGVTGGIHEGVAEGLVILGVGNTGRGKYTIDKR
ncbi:hypothetical protein EJ08DRAFT_629658 [Tothia fuscella]|uniref:Uncharacterized protein n=1 Tax=Tothia fuscella TaxID=1048955 RepID=A0A9P4NV70_9PEZI|nr:hypothetical protein EJ08DRAFT_629658 [Tothia fuscella]